MKRRRWLSVDWPISILSLAQRFRTCQYQSDSATGFITESLRANHVRACFVERIETEQTVKSPLGDETIYRIVEFRQTRFVASNDSPGLEIVDYGRGVGTLVSKLSQLCEYKLSIKSPAVDVFAWADALSLELKQAIIASSAQLSSIELRNGVTGIAVLKGKRDVKQEMKEFFGRTTYVVDKLKLEFPGIKSDYTTLSRDGTARWHRKNDEVLVAALRDSLRSSIIYPV